MKLEIQEAYAHLGAALMQVLPTDEPIIVEHLRQAHAELQKVVRWLASGGACNQGRRGSGKEPTGSVPEALAPTQAKLRQKFTIQVSPEFPPIPDRSCDYAAWIDGEEESTTVTGPTPALALASGPGWNAEEIEAALRRRGSSVGQSH